MKRILMLLINEFKLARTSIPIHLVAIIEPVVMYGLLTIILVHPTQDIYITRPTNAIGNFLVSAMYTVGSPVGLPYINPILTDLTRPDNIRQVITIEDGKDGSAVAVQTYNLIDNNLVKNFRNRLTTSALQLWNTDLGSRAVLVKEHTSLPEDIPYNVYFGMAMIPLTAFLVSALVGGVITAQEFEFQTVIEYRLAPTPTWMVLGTRLSRLTCSSLIGGAAMLIVIGLINNFWPGGILQIGLILIPVSIIGGCIGIIAGLLLRSTLPTFLVGLVTSFFGWIIGDAFKPAVAFGGWFEFFSRFTPQAYAVELIFPYFYGTEISPSWVSILVLSSLSLVLLVLTALIYQRSFSAQVRLV